ncbi:unnamed protein product [Auanema sp. JU1783]|nr:unnamed protein product [Auanema sp. JU1783]
MRTVDKNSSGLNAKSKVFEIMACEDPDAIETYFSKKEHLFPHLEGDKIPTEQFLSACHGIAEFVGFLGTAFSPVRSDIQGNVDKVRHRFEKNKESQVYLQQLIDSDLAENGGKLGIATEGLLWLKRGLEFMLQLLTLMVTEYKMFEDKSRTESLSNAINKAYITTLKRHHGFVSKNLFKIVIHAAPYRKTILKAVALGRENLDDVCIGHIESHLDNFRLNVDALVSYYLEKKLETPQ